MMVLIFQNTVSVSQEMKKAQYFLIGNQDSFFWSKHCCKMGKQCNKRFYPKKIKSRKCKKRLRNYSELLNPWRNGIKSMNMQLSLSMHPLGQRINMDVPSQMNQ